MKEITYSVIDGQGNEQVSTLSDEDGGKIGYAVEEHAVRVWKQIRAESETSVYPIGRVVGIREVTVMDGGTWPKETDVGYLLV